MLQYKAGYKVVPGAVHAQVLDFPSAITCGSSLDEARALLAVALPVPRWRRFRLGVPEP